MNHKIFLFTLLFFISFYDYTFAQNKYTLFTNIELGASIQKYKSTSAASSSPRSQGAIANNVTRLEFSGAALYNAANIGVEKKVNPYVKLGTQIGIGNIGHRYNFKTENLPNTLLAKYNRYQANFSLFSKVYLFSHKKEELEKEKRKRSRKKEDKNLFVNTGVDLGFKIHESYIFDGTNELSLLRERNNILVGYNIGFGLETSKFDYSLQFYSSLNNLLKDDQFNKVTFLRYSFRIAYKFRN